jgi:hypothetical protein
MCFSRGPGVVALCLALAACVACPPDVVRDCAVDDDCAGGNLCVDGDCALAACDPARDDTAACDVDGARGCCRANEDCSAARTCVPDPDYRGDCPEGDATCVPCLETRDCPNDSGDICSAGRCVDTAGLRVCAEDANCFIGERCDTAAFLCLPDACSRCALQPELCCADDAVCDGDRCIPFGSECTDASECRGNEFCDALGRCVFCVGDDDCGPGTVCAVNLGNCVGSASVCDTDSDCIAVSAALRCIDRVCQASECDVDADCQAFDPRATCDRHACLLPPPVCTDTDEPNNDLAHAVPLTADHAGVLCRGDVDLFFVPTAPGEHVTVVVDFADTPWPATVALLNTTGVVLARPRSSLNNEGKAILGATSLVDEGFVLQIRSQSDTIDEARYTVAISTFDAGQCLVSEPVDDSSVFASRCVGDFVAAECVGPPLPTPLVADLAGCALDPAAPGCGHICGHDDVDRVRVGPLSTGALAARLQFDPAAGPLALGVLRSFFPSAPVVDADGDGVIDVFVAADAITDYSFEVTAVGTDGHVAQPYALSIDVDAACVADAFDAAGDNATPATATPLRSTPQAGDADIVAAGIVCADDVDVYGVFVRDGETITVSVTAAPGLRLQVGTVPFDFNAPAVPVAGGNVVVDDSGAAAVTFTSGFLQQVFVTVTDTAPRSAYTLNVAIAP